MKLDSSILETANLTVQSVGHARLVLVGDSGSRLELKNQNVLFRNEDGQVCAYYRHAYRRRMKGVLGTWQSLIRRLRENRTWRYRVTAVFKHFPVSMICSQGGVRVLNYCGVKTSDGKPREFLVDTRGVTVQSLDPRTLVIVSKDRTLAGNIAGRFASLRYKVHLRNMDRRVFSDGFLIEQLDE